MLHFSVGIKAVIVKDGKVLLLHKRSKDLWEGPGGKIDENETIDETLQRELAEELVGIKNIQIGEILHAQRLPGKVLGDTALLLVWYRVDADFPDGINLSDEHDAYAWLDKQDAINTASDEITVAIGKL